MSHQTVPARLNEKKTPGASPSAPVQSTCSVICIKQEYFEDQLPMTLTIKTESSQSPNQRNIMDSIKVEVKEEHYDDHDCLLKRELDFDVGEQINRKIKVEDVSSGQPVQHFKCVKKEEDEDGGEYVMECEDCETCRVKREMKEELDQSGFETELGGNCGEIVQGCNRVKKEEEDGEGERPNKIQHFDREQIEQDNSTLNHVHTDQDDEEEEKDDKTIENREDPTTEQQVQLTAENFVKRIEPADELGNRFECDYRGCARRMKRKCELIRHIRAHTGEMRFACSVAGCDRAFVQKGHLVEHIRTHTGDRPYECDQCDGTFVQHSHLVTHLRTHTGSRPFVCTWPECGQAFISSSHLKSHSFVHSNERQFVCDVTGCAKVYRSKEALRRHLKTKHN